MAVKTMNDADRKWWKEAIVYQVYPLSFCDSNNDGIGDIPGIISKLDYLHSLGVDVIWLSPVYKSPQEDAGYDISAYDEIHKPFGTVEDIDTLLKGLHKRGMKLMMDLVVNHTSSEHKWFKESRSSRDNSKRDYYVWRDPKYDEKGNRVPPNNWLAVFRGGPAWSWDEKTQQYYLRLYTPGQPDLNWENPQVRKEVHDIMRFWLNRGVDGFRMDVIIFISKTPGLPDAEITEEGNYLQPAFKHYANGPRVHEFLKEMNEEVLSKYDLITVGEAPFTHDTKILVEYVKEESKELQTVFTFEHMDVDGSVASPFIPREWKLSEFKAIISKYQIDLLEAGGWHAVYDSNHDQARSINRFGNASPEWRDISAKMLATYHVTLSGTTYIYQGQELAMGNVPKDWTIDDYPDIASKTFYNEIKEQRQIRDKTDNPDMSDIMVGLQKKARDNARTPMHWDDTENAGFSTAKPWMRVNEDYKEYNAKKEEADPESVLNYWKKALRFRKENLACTYGKYRPIEPENEQLFIYTKELNDTTLLVIANFTAETVEWAGGKKYKGVERVFGNYGETGGQGGQVHLKPYEAVVFDVKA